MKTTWQYALRIFSSLCLLVMPAPLLAQEHWPVAIEAMMGHTQGRSLDDEQYRGGRDGELVGVLLGAALHSSERSGPFVALAFDFHAINLDQKTDCVPRPDGGCVPYFPGIGVASLMGGWESASTQLRVLAGMGIVDAGPKTTLGLSGRIDAALPAIWHVSLFGSLQTKFIPSWHGDRLLYTAVSVGLRLR